MPTMQKYLVFLRSTPHATNQARPSPAQMQEMYGAFQAWQQKYGANIVDLGGQLKAGGKIVTPGGVTDGPYAEAKEVVGGFMVLAAESVDRAAEIARACPGVVRPGASVEIREILTP
jgi:hypothetical protein